MFHMWGEMGQRPPVQGKHTATHSAGNGTVHARVRGRRGETQSVVSGASQLMMLSVAAMNSQVNSPRTMKLKVQIQEKEFCFLIDSGSSTCLIDANRVEELQGKQQLAVGLQVQIAGGSLLKTEWCFPQLQWSVDSILFTDNFKVLALGSYDGILGWDWLAKHSPMLTHWEEGWLAIKHQGETVVLHGMEGPIGDPEVLLLQLMQEGKTQEHEDIPVEVQSLLTGFSSVFATPTGLPPRRQYDHKIPLIPGARPVSIRPY